MDVMKITHQSKPEVSEIDVFMF